MTTKIHKAAAMLATACALALTPGSASGAIVYTDGDLILGFRANGGTGANTDYLIDLGNAASIINSQVPITFSLGAVALDLNTIYTSGWTNRSDVLWSVSGVQKAAGNGFSTNTMFATRSDSISAPLGTATTTPWFRFSVAGGGAPALKIQSLGVKFGLGTSGNVSGTDQIESTNAPGALIQPISQSNSYASFMPGGSNSNASTAFLVFPDANGIEGTFGSGTVASVLDLYKVVPGSGGATLPSEFTGTFSITNGAVVTYTPFVVPEPTTATALAVGGAFLASMRRRRAVTKAS